MTSFQYLYILAALMLISICTLLKMPNPLNPMQILWINVIMDGPPAQSLGLEPADPGVLKKPPRSPKEQILTRSLMTNILLSAAVIIIGTMWVHKVMKILYCLQILPLNYVTDNTIIISIFIILVISRRWKDQC